MRKRKKVPVSFIVAIVLAFVLSFAATQFLPVPDHLEKLAFLLLVPLFSCAGVVTISLIKKGR